LVAIPVDDGGERMAVFEVADDAVGDLELASDGHRLTEQAQVSLERALDDLKPALARLKETVRGLAPHGAEIEFGLKLGGETGIVIAKGTAEVNFRVRISWNWNEA
jgi:hypothetical protein